MEQVTFWIASARGIQLAAMLSGFGAALFRVAVVPGPAFPFDRRIVRLEQISLAIAVGAIALWLPLEAASMADAASIGDATRAVSTVVTDTRFGRLILLRAGLLIVSLGMSYGTGQGSSVVTLTAAALGCASQALIGHAAASGSVLLPAVEALHVLAAGAWLGGLAPLWLALSTSTERKAALSVLRRFSRLGMACVAILAITAVFQGITLIGGIGAWFGTFHGALATSKAILFVVLLGLAALNYFRLAPALARNGAAARLRLCIAFEIAFGIAVIFAAATMAGAVPGAHAQPEWPFAWRPSFEPAIHGYQRRALIEGAATVGTMLALLMVALFWRRGRWAVLAAAILLPLLAPLPPLQLMFVPANATSYYRSPTGFSAASIARGEALFAKQCGACHGTDGRGNLASTTGMPPDLTGPDVRTMSDGDLFWSLNHGVPTGMSAEARWNLIDYLRAHGAGVDIAETGEWMFPVAAPSLPTMPRGHLFRAVIGNHGGNADSTIATVTIDSPESRTAYAVVAGLAPDQLAGTQFLIDANGWLRAIMRPGDAANLQMALQDIAAHPLAAVTAAHRH